MEPADLSCSKKSSLGTVLYSKDRYYGGYINVCNGDYHAACVYAFIIGYAVVQETGSYSERRIATFLEVARSLLDAGEKDLARMILCRAFTEHYEIAPEYQIGPSFFEMLLGAGGKFSGVPDTESGEPWRRPMAERKSTQREAALAFLKAGDTVKAREAAIEGLGELKKSPDTEPKMETLLVYADIFGRIDGRLSPELAKELERQIRTTPYVHFEKRDRGTPEPADYVAEGERLLSQQRVTCSRLGNERNCWATKTETPPK